MRHYRELADLVIERVAPLILERHYAAIKRGETIKYGKIQADQTGLRLGRKSVAWSEIGSCGIDDESLTIELRRENRDWACSVSEVDNLHVLLLLIARQKRA